MADIYMHERLAKEVMKARKITEHTALFLLGSQGPDPFYYVVFSEDFKPAREIGDRLHDTNINRLLTRMTNYVKDHYSDALYAYYQGFLLHFALDTNIHPYVYHHVGVFDSEDSSTQAMRGLHLKFERSIDKILVEEDHRKKAHRYAWINGVPKVSAKKDLENLYEHVVFETLNVANGGKLFLRGVKGMRRVIKLFMKDRFGFKKWIYRLIDKRSTSQDLFYEDMSLYGDVEAYDFLNREHRSWRHPITNEPSQKSVDDLYLDAYEDALKYLAATESYIKNGQSLDFNVLFGNRSFNSGIDCEDPRSMQYFSLYR